MLRMGLLFLLLAMCGGSDPLDEEWETVLWGPTGPGGVVWEEQPDAPKNLTAANATRFHDEDILTPAGNISLNFTSAENILTTGSIHELMEFALLPEERKLYDKLNTLFDDFFTLSNRTMDDSAWSFVTFVTLMPLRCSEVQKVASLFDAAMRESNPESEIHSIAQRLGDAACGPDGVCPCKDVRRHSKRVMELHSTSRKRELQPPARFPYQTRMEWP
jgi:hypothetical protein